MAIEVAPVLGAARDAGIKPEVFGGIGVRASSVGGIGARGFTGVDPRRTLML